VVILVVFIIVLVVGCLIKRQQKNRIEANPDAQEGSDEEDNPDGDGAAEKPPNSPPPDDPEDNTGPPQGGWMANGGQAIPRANSKPDEANGDIRKKGDPEPTLPNAVIDLEEPDNSSTNLHTLVPVTSEHRTPANGAWPQYYPLIYRTYTPHTISLPGNQIVKGGSMSETKDIALCSVV
jgi:hypothetical protein